MDAPFPPEFFARADESPDPDFYSWPRMVTHIDDDAIDSVGSLYEELGLTGDVLDLMASWVSHFRTPPERLTVLGLNPEELAANPMASERVVQDLNSEPALPFADESFDGAVCCVSVDYLTRPLAVFAEVARVLRPGGVFACAVSNRCFPSKAVRGWLLASEEHRLDIVRAYFLGSGGWEDVHAERRTPAAHRGDPLWAVWATRGAAPPPAAFR
jgi:SAM-dependent methyltransferase